MKRDVLLKESEADGEVMLLLVVVRNVAATCS
jgi:hypothetical protein